MKKKEWNWELNKTSHCKWMGYVVNDWGIQLLGRKIVLLIKAQRKKPWTRPLTFTRSHDTEQGKTWAEIKQTSDHTTSSLRESTLQTGDVITSQLMGDPIPILTPRFSSSPEKHCRTNPRHKISASSAAASCTSVCITSSFWTVLNLTASLYWIISQQPMHKLEPTP